MTPTARTLVELRCLGYTAAVVEHWKPWAKVRQDLYGFIDVLVVKAGGSGVFAIQCTTEDHASNHLHKAEESPNLRVWLVCGNRFEVWGWAKRGARRERKTWWLERRIVNE